MKARISKLTPAQAKEFNQIIRRNVSESMQDIQLQLDFLWLNAVRRVFGFGSRRLKKVYQEYFKMRNEFIEFYESDGYDGMVESASYYELHNAGCEVPEWYREFGSPRVEYRITKGVKNERK